jgi:hypothetical protein
MKIKLGIRGVAAQVSATFWLETLQGQSAPAQLQYSQKVLLNFNGLSWPHVTVATLQGLSEIRLTGPGPGGRVTFCLDMLDGLRHAPAGERGKGTMDKDLADQVTVRARARD